MSADSARDADELRRARHAKLSAAIADLDDGELLELFASSEPNTGWGRHQAVEIAGTSVFVKRIPVTDLERANAYSTRNLYELPLFYQYGVGSAGFGVFRELAMHMKTTQWVLDGAIANFPIMYHHRIVPRAKEKPQINEEQLDRYERYWGGSSSVRAYSADRFQATHELAVLLEYFPHTLHPWLMTRQDRLPRFLEELRHSVDFLRTHGVIHFDAQPHNIVTDGQDIYLTDFGLALDRAFELSDEEIAFFDGHTHYDYGEVLWSTGYLIAAAYNALSDGEKVVIKEKLRIAEAGPLADSLLPLVDNVELLADDPRLNFRPEYVAAVMRYRPIIHLVQDFFVALRANPRKDTPYPHAELRRLLRETGFSD
jgi:hypothetical protein